MACTGVFLISRPASTRSWSRKWLLQGVRTMAEDLIELEEEEHTSQLTGAVFKRIVGLLRAHWRWVIGFLAAIALTSVLDSGFTFINKQIIDQGISLKDVGAVYRLALLY